MKVVDFLKQKAVPFETVPHRETFDAQHMAESLHVSGHRVAKTVLLRANGDFKFVVAVLPATGSVDVEAATRMLGGSQLKIASEAEVAEHCPECEVGALPPFGSQYNMETIVDQRIAAQEDIVFEGDTHHESIRMKYADFARIEEPLVGSFAAAD